MCFSFNARIYVYALYFIFCVRLFNLRLPAFICNIIGIISECSISLTMSEGSRPNANYTSEASRMLEAALEQMDGIIQGAKYELPTYFDNFSIQVDWMSQVSQQVILFRFRNLLLRIPQWKLPTILMRLLKTSRRQSQPQTQWPSLI